MKRLWRTYRAYRPLRVVGVPRRVAWAVSSELVASHVGSRAAYYKILNIHRLRQAIDATAYCGERMTFETYNEPYLR